MFSCEEKIPSTRGRVATRDHSASVMGFSATMPVSRHQQWASDRMVLPRLSFGVILVAILLALVSGGPPIFVLAAKGVW